MQSSAIRVVHVINSLGLGGAERFAHDLVTKLDPELFRVHMLCLYREGELAASVREAGIPVQVLGLERPICVRNWLRVYRALRQLNADIVHAHLPEACWLALPTARLAGVPVRIAHLQNVYAHWRLKLRLFDRTASTFANKAVACSEAVRRFYENEIYYPAEKLEVFYNSVDTDRFKHLPTRSEARRRLGLPQAPAILICIASLEQQKGHPYLIEAMLKVRTALPDVLLLLVGDGSLRRKLEGDVESSGLTTSVNFLGRRTDIPLLLAAADLLVLSSLWEGLGLVLAEAGASGLPVVATRVDGIPEIIRDRVTGLLAPPRNSQFLADAIVSLLQDDRRRLEMGENARNLVNERFSMGRVAERMGCLYSNLLASSNRPRAGSAFQT